METAAFSCLIKVSAAPGARVTLMAIEFFSANMATRPDGYEYTTILHSSNWGEVLIPLPIFVVERLRATVPHCHRQPDLLEQMSASIVSKD